MGTTQITAQPGVPFIEITREFDAPRDLVFRAHTDPELLVQWLGPRRQLCVTDINAARAEFVERGLDISPVRHVDNGEWLDGHGGPYNSFAFFKDPDGNDWALQEK